MTVSNDTLRHRIELAFGLALFGVNAAFALLLYLELASGTWYYEAIYATLSVVFDAAMMLLWIRGRKTRNVVFVAIAIGFAAISLFASSASALTIVERKVQVVNVDTSQLDALRAALASTDADIEANRRAIDKTPPDFTTRLRELNAIGAKLRERRDAQAQEMALRSDESAQSRSTATSMFSLVAKALSVSEAAVMLPFLLGTSLMLIVGSFALTAPPRARETGVRLVQYGALSHVVRDGRALCGAREAPPDGPGRPCAICKSRLEVEDGKARN